MSHHGFPVPPLQGADAPLLVPALAATTNSNNNPAATQVEDERLDQES